MGYGLRNVNDRPKAILEMHRVLKPGLFVAPLGILLHNPLLHQLIVDRCEGRYPGL